VVTVLAKHWLVNNRYIIKASSSLSISFSLVMLSPFFFVAVVTVNTDPVHFAAAANFVFTNNRYVIFCATSYHASTATGTGVKVDSHNPVINRAIVDMIIP
jgi:hypothetical protein